MRPSYDAEHPHSATPIYDELYSEYRRLFRALPGDRSGEENLKFAGFAVRDGYPVLADPRPYPPQHQAFHTYAGQAAGIPQFMPSQQNGSGAAGHTHHGGQGDPVGGHGPLGAPGDPTGDSGGHTAPAGHPNHANQGGRADHNNRHTPNGHQDAPPAQPASHFTNGQGWVAAGYLGPVPHPMPAPPPAPAPALGPGTDNGTTTPGENTAPQTTTRQSTGGRHRNLLSLPPGRGSDQH
ncbi:hypothetical protein [Kitasatospora sp. NPDC087315]|uniref:hypothetical protein n=1 Tax=Kitasatospora sp. NPDC087315 TaxID=3364069 RepID=UPI0037F29E04